MSPSTSPSEGPGGRRLLAPRLDRAAAERAFSRPRWFARLLGRRPRRGRLELIYLPVVRVDASVRDTTSGETRRVSLAVDAVGGAVNRLDRDVDSGVAGEPAAGELFAARISTEQALDRVREELPWLLLGVALKANRGLSVERLDVVDRVGYPYWVQHVRHGGTRDVEVIDALSGQRAGARGKATVVEAFLGSRAARPAG